MPERAVNREQRRRHKARQPRRHSEPDMLPVVPGVLPDDSKESLARAMDEAHEVLAPLAGAKVSVLVWTREEGLPRIEEAFGVEGRRVIERELHRLGPDALVTVAMRVPRGWKAANQ